MSSPNLLASDETPFTARMPTREHSTQRSASNVLQTPTSTPKNHNATFAKFAVAKTPKRSSSQPNILTNKNALKHFNKVTWKGNNQPELVLNGTRILLTPEQIALLVEKQNKLRMERIQKAKSRGNQLMKLSKDKNYEQAVEDATELIQAFILGYTTRKHLRKQHESASAIQRWWMLTLPAQRAYKIALAERAKVLEEARNKRSDVQNVEFVQEQLRHFMQYLARRREIQKEAVEQVFNYSEAILVAKQTLRMKKYVVRVQSGIRSFLSLYEGSDDFIHVKAQMMKQRVLELYQQLAAPYPRRAIFCFKTKDLNRESYVYAVREMSILSKLKEPLMTPEAYRKHLSHVLKTLFAYERDMDFIKVVRTVYQPQIVFHKKKGKTKVYNYRFDGKRQPTGLMAKLMKSSAAAEQGNLPYIPRQDHLRIEDPVDNTGKIFTKPHFVPLSLVLKELVKVLFSPEASLRRNDWSSVLMFKYVMGDEIKNVSTVMSVDKKTHKSEPEVANFFEPNMREMDLEGN